MMTAYLSILGSRGTVEVWAKWSVSRDSTYFWELRKGRSVDLVIMVLRPLPLRSWLRADIWAEWPT